MFKDSVVYLFWFALLAVVFGYAFGCGSIVPLSGAAGGGEGGRAAGGAGGGELVDVDAAAASDAAAPPCLDASAPGLAFNGTCEGGAAATKGCHAACTLNGAPFVGCVAGSPWASACYADCAGCTGGL